ncbi:MAG: PD40 domain-containing protein, partial [Thermoanaerobaculia bacterium]|nr:PD40 domain-containing protein [Thermoanaerobaculia bacterium]
MKPHLLALVTVLIATAATGPGTAAGPDLLAPGERHFADLRQLTFGGENAEAYWSPDGSELVMQSTRPPYGCDQIFRLPVDPPGEPRLVSTGTGRTTCAYFTFPAGERILFASTHHASESCPAPPDMSRGYVWALYPEYELYSARPDGSELARLTENEVYDAEATVCQKDGSIVFTSTRDGDLELYRMDADGGNLLRLTQEPGYDGGAFFSPDCSQIVWRASRPQGEALAEYQRLLGEHKVRPSRMEIWIANADGTEARQVTYLGAASFAPYFHPAGERILFSSNLADPDGREFDIWAVNVDGSGLERITTAPDFDGFPIFSPDGSRLAFSSNRNQGQPGETNVFVARWVEREAEIVERPADRFARDVAWLADDAREGRGVGSEGIEAAARYLEE